MVNWKIFQLSQRKYLRYDELHGVVHQLFARHHHHQLDAQLEEAAAAVAAVQAVTGEEVLLVSLHLLTHVARLGEEFPLQQFLYLKEVRGGNLILTLKRAM